MARGVGASLKMKSHPLCGWIIIIGMYSTADENIR